MENTENLQASSDDDEALIAELEQRPSTFPNIGIDLWGYENEEFARSVGNEVSAFLNLFGKLLNLERLHKVIVAYDYAGALASLDRGIETTRTLTPTKDIFAEGIAMTPAILVDGDPRSVMVLNAFHMAVLAYPDDQKYAEIREYMIHTLAHESGHVHDLAMQVKMFPGVMLKMKLPYREAVLFPIAIGCWDEYIASRLSAHFGNDHTTKDFENTFCSALVGARDRGDTAIRQYRMHVDRPKLVDEVTGEYRRVLVYASYLLGHLDGLSESVEDSAPKANELVKHTSYFTPFFDRLRLELRAMHDTYGEWKDIAVYEPLKQIAYDLLKVGGLDIQTRGEDGYVDVPFTPQTIPSLGEQIEFRMSKKKGSIST
jgi:hypothetical protein